MNNEAYQVIGEISLFERSMTKLMACPICMALGHLITHKKEKSKLFKQQNIHLDRTPVPLNKCDDYKLLTISITRTLPNTLPSTLQ